MNVLFVCTANVCRSPMAEAFLRELRPGFDVRSCGTHALAGRPATYDARQVMRAYGVPVDAHRARMLEPEMVRWADVIAGLASEHVRYVVKACPGAAGKTFTLRELAGDEPADVDDPFGEREAAYKRVAAQIRELVQRWHERLS